MQSYLSVIDPMLFPILKTVRRSFALQPRLKWAIDDEIAVALYAYQSGLPLVNIGTPDLHLSVQAKTVEDVSRLESVLEELVRLGFSRNDMTLHYPLSMVYMRITLVDQVEGNWVRNRKGKATYPLHKVEHILKRASKEKESWVKDVVNNVIIE